MITIEQIRTTDIDKYLFIEELLVSAFPQEEHRELSMQREFTDTNKLFHNNILLVEGSPIGLLSYWDFDHFIYVEHFAIHPDHRNGGIGQQALQSLQQKVQRPIVLEVELPTDEMSKRRIEFYQRQGFTLCQKSYQQPPYRKGDGLLPMYLMIQGSLDMEDVFNEVKAMIYKEVYQVD